LASTGFFGDPDSIELLAHHLVGSGDDGVAQVVGQVGEQVSRTVESLVPYEWSGQAADVFAETLQHEVVRNLIALAEAARSLGAPLTRLASDLRVANRMGDRAKELAQASGFEIDSHGNVLIGLRSLEHWIVPVDELALDLARADMMAARNVAESAWETARYALANLAVPRIGAITLEHAEDWGFSSAQPPLENVVPDPHPTLSGLLPTTPRPDGDVEGQRLYAIELVQQQCRRIREVADAYGVPPEAIAGAILWEALENPRRLIPPQEPWPGKVHVVNRDLHMTDAERAEIDGKIPKASGWEERTARLVLSPDWAIRYIGAILADNVDVYRGRNIYESRPGVPLSRDIGVLLTLYEEGYGERKADDLARRRRSNPSEPALVGGSMGPWVLANLPWIRAQLTCP